MLELIFNSGMDLYKRRQQNLLNLIARESGGNRVAFCNTFDVSESRLAQLLSDKFRDGKAFGERAARSLEEKLGLEPLYFESMQVKSENAPYSDSENSKNEHHKINQPLHDYVIGVKMIYADAREIELLSRFRESTEHGKELIEISAATSEKDLRKIRLVKQAG